MRKVVALAWPRRYLLGVFTLTVLLLFAVQMVGSQSAEKLERRSNPSLTPEELYSDPIPLFQPEQTAIHFAHAVFYEMEVEGGKWVCTWNVWENTWDYYFVPADSVVQYIV